MAGCSKKQYAIMMQAGTDGKKLASEMGGMEQEAFNKAFSELLGSSGGYNQDDDEDYRDFDPDSEDDYGFDEEDDEYDRDSSIKEGLDYIKDHYSEQEFGNIHSFVEKRMNDWPADERAEIIQKFKNEDGYDKEMTAAQNENADMRENEPGDINNASSRRLDLIRTNANLKVLDSLSDEQLEPFVDEILSMPETKDTKQMAQMIRENPNLKVLKGLDDNQIKAVVEEIKTMPMKDEDLAKGNPYDPEDLPDEGMSAEELTKKVKDQEGEMTKEDVNRMRELGLSAFDFDKKLDGAKKEAFDEMSRAAAAKYGIDLGKSESPKAAKEKVDEMKSNEIVRSGSDINYNEVSNYDPSRHTVKENADFINNNIRAINKKGDKLVKVDTFHKTKADLENIIRKYQYMYREVAKIFGPENVNLETIKYWIEL